MAWYDKLLEDAVKIAIQAIEKKVGAPPQTMESLVTGDDWSFVIRAHALLEGAVSLLLSAHLDERLRPIFGRLELGREDTGKLEFAKALGVLTKEERGFVRLLSQLRNKLAHDPRHLDFTFSKYLQSASTQARAEFYSVMSNQTSPQHKDKWLEYVASNPRQAVSGRFLILLAQLLLKASSAETKNTSSSG